MSLVNGCEMQGHTDATEQWYGTEYSLQRLPDNWIQTWENVGEINDLHLPSLNPFVPTELDLIAVIPLLYKPLKRSNVQ